MLIARSRQAAALLIAATFSTPALASWWIGTPGDDVKVIVAAEVEVEDVVVVVVSRLDDRGLPVTRTGERGARSGERGIDAGLGDDVIGRLPPCGQPNDLGAEPAP